MRRKRKYMELTIPKGIHPELLTMIRQGLLSPEKVIILIEIKATVDRFSTKLFSEESVQASLEENYGSKPDIITWGDYFQTEVASRFFLEEESALRKIADTIRFDLISSHLIYSGKPEYFKTQIRSEALVSKGIDASHWNEDQEESAHLEILLDYFENLGIGEKPLSLQDKAWYEGFQINQMVG